MHVTQPKSCDSEQLLIGLPIKIMKLIKIVFNFNKLLFSLSYVFHEILAMLLISEFTLRAKEKNLYF